MRREVRVRKSKTQLVAATENGTTTTALSRRLRYGPGAPSGGRPRACRSNTSAAADAPAGGDHNDPVIPRWHRGGTLAPRVLNRLCEQFLQTMNGRMP
jgi:hypothetical protein